MAQSTSCDVPLEPLTAVDPHDAQPPQDSAIGAHTAAQLSTAEAPQSIVTVSQPLSAVPAANVLPVHFPDSSVVRTADSAGVSSEALGKSLLDKDCTASVTCSTTSSTSAGVQTCDATSDSQPATSTAGAAAPPMSHVTTNSSSCSVSHVASQQPADIDSKASVADSSGQCNVTQSSNAVISTAKAIGNGDMDLLTKSTQPPSVVTASEQRTTAAESTNVATDERQPIAVVSSPAVTTLSVPQKPPSLDATTSSNGQSATPKSIVSLGTSSLVAAASTPSPVKSESIVSTSAPVSTDTNVQAKSEHQLAESVQQTVQAAQTASRMLQSSTSNALSSSTSTCASSGVDGHHTNPTASVSGATLSATASVFPSANVTGAAQVTNAQQTALLQQQHMQHLAVAQQIGARLQMPHPASQGVIPSRPNILQQSLPPRGRPTTSQTTASQVLHGGLNVRLPAMTPDEQHQYRQQQFNRSLAIVSQAIVPAIQKVETELQQLRKEYSEEETGVPFEDSPAYKVVRIL